ncbi:CFEM domain-containing protein [Colletotrichum lupini]|uniref:CFEM domain-containing protein n=1 Tax=Colletotrichum lupini TaxID=145971 RepID=A0A9Q8WFU7_9PEZI|nr:CFEM domain-containing protein [Colletotrichum lupini]UQC81711.1 CFEM domain-containing protein [Colletotrichum lupini]
MNDGLNSSVKCHTPGLGYREPSAGMRESLRLDNNRISDECTSRHQISLRRATTLMSVPMSVVVVFTVQNGLGKDIWTLTPEQINEFFKLFYIGEHFYAFTVMFAKTNFLFFYLRLFSDEKFRRLTWGVIWACVISAVSFLVATSVQCWPISYTWTKWDGEHQGRCHDINVQTWAHASVNIALDVIVVAMPISQIVRLNWRWRQKVGAGNMMFAVALLITFVSILRLSSIKDFMKTSNPTCETISVVYFYDGDEQFNI